MGEVASVESLSGDSQKEASLKVDLLNQSLLLHHINEEGEAREEWRKEFLDGIDTSKDGFLDRAEVIGIVSTFLFAEL